MTKATNLQKGAILDRLEEAQFSYAVIVFLAIGRYKPLNTLTYSEAVKVIIELNSKLKGFI